VAGPNRWWKVLGVASVVGVVATGVLVARDERERRSYTPDEVRDRLRERLTEVDPDDGAAPG
jgi:cytochrome c-type biogenesis protein CcmE